MNTKPSASLTSSAVSRRHFLAQAGGGVIAASTLGRTFAQGTAASSRIRLGLVGCGQRGQWILDLFAAHGGYEIVAAADYFQDKISPVAVKYNLKPAQTFTGLRCAEKMIAHGGLDAVAIISPPFFHPAQARAAIDAGLHVYLAKPVAVDVPGCLAVRGTGELARRKGLVLHIDFQTRANEFYVEAIRRLHAGALGDLCFGEASFHANRLDVKAPPGTPEARLRNWVFDQALSGDFIVEQSIHAIDVMSWMMKEKPPLHCTGTGGRRVRIDVGDCWDHFALVYEYADHVGFTFSSRQFDGHGNPGGIVNQIFGSKGVFSGRYGGEVLIRGKAETFYRGGKTSAIYLEGTVANIKSFHEFVSSKNAANHTLEPGVTSTLVATMGRIAAYEGRTVTWDELMKMKQRTNPDLSGLVA